jgi:hypothetical protein
MLDQLDKPNTNIYDTDTVRQFFGDLHDQITEIYQVGGGCDSDVYLVKFRDQSKFRLLKLYAKRSTTEKFGEHISSYIQAVKMIREKLGGSFAIDNNAIDITNVGACSIEWQITHPGKLIHRHGLHASIIQYPIAGVNLSDVGQIDHPPGEDRDADSLTIDLDQLKSEITKFISYLGRVACINIDSIGLMNFKVRIDQNRKKIIIFCTDLADSIPLFNHQNGFCNIT